MNSLILMSLWGGVGYGAIIFIAGIRGIPKEYFEAAMIDGASPLQVNWYVTLPLLSRVITFLVVTGFIGGFQVFQQVYLMTHGGPLNATRTIALSIYETAFNRLKIGTAASMAFILFIIVTTLTIIQMRIQRSNWEL
jgi:ABC-type sugar transport system permease subunit